jgi:hypothetical protein
VFSADGSGVLTPGTDFTVSGTIANTSDQDFPAGTATVYLDGSVIGTRADLSSWLDSGDTVAADKLGAAVATIGTPAIAAGRTASISIPVPAAAVGIAADAAWGARKLAVLVTDGTSEIGQSRSTVVWNSSSSYSPVSLAIALPLTVPTPTTGLIPAETLATDTSINGVLTRELDEAIDRHIAIGIDPMIITSIRILGSSVPASARDWLSQRDLPPDLRRLRRRRRQPGRGSGRSRTDQLHHRSEAVPRLHAGTHRVPDNGADPRSNRDPGANAPHDQQHRGLDIHDGSGRSGLAGR